MFEKETGEWQVEVDGTRTNDGKEVQRLFSQLLNKDRTTIHVLNFDNLRDKQTILFFDEVIKRGLSDEWCFCDVVALTFRRGRDEITEAENDEQIPQATLTGIRQAILEGGHLRDDAFVKKFEKEGCVFAAMTLAFQNTTAPETIHIRAEFKGSPKIFEVSIVNSYASVSEGTDVKLTTCPLPVKRNLQIRSEFWNNSRKIYKEILSGEIN